MQYKVTELEGTTEYVLIAPDGTVVRIADRPRTLVVYAFATFGDEIEVKHEYNHQRGDAANWKR